MTTRRAFLKILGGGTVLAATGGAAWLATRTPAAALAPWNEAPTYTDPRRHALAHALLAPNPHNRQPWLVALGEGTTMTLHRDPGRALPMTDPFHRQIYIGLGCFLELLDIASGLTGHRAHIDLFPRGEDGPVADIALVPTDAAPDPLSAHILTRRSHKEGYLPDPLPAAATAALAPFGRVHDDPAEVDALRKLIFDALSVEIATERTLRESVELMRIGKAEINANPDGLEMRDPLMEFARVIGVLDEDMLMDTGSGTFRRVMAEYRATFDATPAFVTVTTDGNSRRDQVEAGRRWLRINMIANAAGLGVHPCSQALQEFPEMAALYAEAHRRLAAPGQTVQMLGRIGTPRHASAPTPRWGLETRLIDG